MSRPRKNLRPEDYLLVEQLAGWGASINTIAKRLNMAYGTFRNNLARDERAKEAFDNGRGQMESQVKSALLKVAIDPDHPKQVTAAIVVLKMFYGYTDQPVQKVPENKVEITFQLPAALSPDEYEKKVLDITPAKALKEAGIES
jgi:hypothetical protein